MLMPSNKPLFENVSSREYYIRAGMLKSKAFDGCIHITYPDYEEAIIFLEGEPITAIQEWKRWLTVGDDLVEAAENKAIAAEGRMAAYQLPQELLHIFIHKYVNAMIEAELGPYMTAKLLIGYLANDKSTCVLKLSDGHATGYVFMNFGKRTGAIYDSPEGRAYGDSAISEMDHFKEHTSVTIYFTELSEKYLKQKAKARAEAHFVEKPFDTIMPTIKPIMAKQMPAPQPIEPPAVKLVVATSSDRSIRLAHRSRLQTLEMLEEAEVAWIDRKAMAKLNMIGNKAHIALPDGKTQEVTIRQAEIKAEEGKYIIIPRKLRKRLALNEGMIVQIMA
ncbi:hypothetical protein [Methanocella conradii]|uniref:hypothetical protein n=1 Tax=Methanocella conradii TaxID=1175444 RepID=UPI00157D6AE0|nr:hypothetical protein [Methanocella conradii]